ncbi:non-classical arabinogalactan protein 31-like [Hordeum vulgare subsp. vulgare]|uniref:Non-classical arabinogalactan protein 30 n=1 Tax=Hordeum vulgare subsp. vulgare TaxID=112509 RepID=A0A8I6WM03_HORVV|nr:non-classical arabinogalactan protein 31-like [Hordeum vulgare subsp. vulgare]
MVSVSFKIHGAGVTTVAVLLLGSLLLFSDASMDEPAAYKHVAPAPSPLSYPPTPAPSKPIHPVIIVQGIVYCKSCKLRGYNAGMDASPLPNATAKLVCYGSKGGYRVLNMTSTATDENGYFLAMVYDLAMFSRRSCRVYLRTSPTPLCDAPFLPADASLGIVLKREEVKPSSPEGVRGVYSARTALMYAPRKGAKCPAYY